MDLFYIVLGTVFWPNKQTCHPVRKVPDRNAKPCKGNNNQHMLSCSAKVFKNFNSHNVHNCPTSCHVTVTILQMTNLVSTEVGVSQWLWRPPLDLRILTLGGKLDKDTSEAHCNPHIPLFLHGCLLLIFALVFLEEEQDTRYLTGIFLPCDSNYSFPSMECKRCPNPLVYGCKGGEDKIISH